MFNKKLLLIVSLIAAVSVSSVAAGEESKSIGEVKFEVNPAILKSNPFYSIVDLRWNVKEWFVSNKLDETLLKARILDQKAAEYAKLRSLSKNEALVTTALVEYQSSVYSFDRSLRRVALVDTVERGDELASLLRSTLLHIRFSDDVLGSSQLSSEQAAFLDIQDRLVVLMVHVITEFEAEQALRSVVLPAADAPVNVANEIRLAEMLDLLAAQATGETQVLFQELRGVLLARVRAELSQSISLKAATGDAFDISLLAGTDKLRVRTLSELFN